jgi:thioredoxin:protein disulfide reductase
MVTRLTSTGSPARPARRAERSGSRQRRPRPAAALALGLCLALGAHALPALALDLLPPHEAFALTARALDAATLEVRFAIADGYYLYRDKLRFAIGAADAPALAPLLPPGKMKHDEFFGDSETYRGLLVATVPLAQAAAPGGTLKLVVESQGCADAGVCYPPQRQVLEVPVPSNGSGPGPIVEAPAGKPPWLK